MCNWLFANRMRDEVTDVYNDLQRAALNLSLAIAVDGQEKACPPPCVTPPQGVGE